MNVTPWSCGHCGARSLRTRATNIAGHARWLAANGSSDEARAYGRAGALSCQAPRRVGLERFDAAADRDIQRDVVAARQDMVALGRSVKREPQLAASFGS